MRRVVKDPNFNPKNTKEILREIFVTSYLGSTNSTLDTTSRAKRVADGIGSLHLEVSIDEAYEAVVNIFKKVSGTDPKYECNGGTKTEDLAL